MTDAARLRITLLYLDPAPWREVEVPLSMTFKGLHDTIQAAFQWFDYHLWEFDFGGRRYGIPFDDGFGDDDKVYSASTARLTKLRDTGVKEFRYVYDMGDNWEHLIEVTGLFEAERGSRLPRFVNGKWRAPPEDVGGPPGFEMFLEAMADPAHEDHDDLLEWYDGPFDPEDINEQYVKIQMGRLANMRRPKK
ncbi:MAG: plasmid pRiA4b ORF-3 family protein [Paracoccaceae bacterium]